jgi:hypothetical protein
VTDGAPTAMASRLEQGLALFVGPRWATYRRKFAPFFEEPAFTPTWNWAAAIGTEFWFLYRKMYLWFAVFFFVPTLAIQWLWGDQVSLEAVTAPANTQLRLIIVGVQLSSRLAAGGIANWLLFRRASMAVRVVDAQPMGDADREQFLRRLGGTNRTFTLLLLAVFALMSLLQVAAGTMR